MAGQYIGPLYGPLPDLKTSWEVTAVEPSTDETIVLYTADDMREMLREMQELRVAFDGNQIDRAARDQLLHRIDRVSARPSAERPGSSHPIDRVVHAVTTNGVRCGDGTCWWLLELSLHFS